MGNKEYRPNNAGGYDVYEQKEELMGAYVYQGQVAEKPETEEAKVERVSIHEEAE